MYTKTAEYYDLIYSSFKNYEEEAAQVRQLISAELPSCKTILDVACGTGEHHLHLKSQFKVTGIDLNETFIDIAKKKNPECEYHTADMRQFDLKTKFDAIVCLFSSIGYLGSQEEVVRALHCFKNHLAPHGVIFVEPWFTAEVWKVPNLHMVTVEREGLKVCRASSSQKLGRTSRADMHYLIATADGVRYESEEHALTLFSIEEMKEAFLKTGLVVEHCPVGLIGRGMYKARLVD